jgi:hypothetical protein
MKYWLSISLLIIVSFAKGQTLNLCSNAYSAHATINLTWSSGSKSITIAGDSINSGNSSTACIRLTGYDTVIIKRCKLVNSTAQAIVFTNCRYTKVDSCYMSNVSDGIHDNFGTGKPVYTNNYISIVNGPFPLGNGIQLNQVNSSTGGLIQNNFIENIDGISLHPQDLISVYKSNFAVGDSLMVLNNYIRGGQIINDSGGAAGIVLNDVGGSYQVARGNILVNPGAVGIQIQGGHGSKVDHNKIYGDGHGLKSFEGLQYGNYSSDTTYAIEMSYNKIYWRQVGGAPVFNRWVDKAIAVAASTTSGHAGGPTLPDPVGWSTNTPVTFVDTSIKYTMLPTTLITSCSGPIAPIISYPSSLYAFIVNVAITPITPANIGTPATITWSASGLPVGLTINTATGQISGTPTVTSSGTYTITATDTYGSGTTVLTLSVINLPTHIAVRRGGKAHVLP